MEIEQFLKNVLGFEPISNVEKEPHTLPFLPSGFFQEFVRGKWRIRILDTHSLEDRAKIGVIVLVDIGLKQHTLYKGYINQNDGLSQFRRMLQSCTDLLDNPDDYSCEKIILSQDNPSLHSSACIHMYYIWKFDDLLASSIPSGFNVLIPENVPFDDCIDFVNGYLLNLGASHIGTKTYKALPNFNKSYAQHFRSVGVNVLDLDESGRLVLNKDTIKDKIYKLKNVETAYIVRFALKAILEKRTDYAIEFLKDVGLIKDMIISRTKHNTVRIAFMSVNFGDIEVVGCLDEILKNIQRKFGKL
tara:strand:- start:14368 stop:15273 length:906 start_codon:yes stop_codon:yes gene_type:complete